MEKTEVLWTERVGGKKPLAHHVTQLAGRGAQEALESIAGPGTADVVRRTIEAIPHGEGTRTLFESAQIEVSLFADKIKKVTGLFRS